MVDIFETKMCNYCKNKNCNKNIVIIEDKNLLSYKCNNYVKDCSKIVCYEEPLTVTAERDYCTRIER